MIRRISMILLLSLTVLMTTIACSGQSAPEATAAPTSAETEPNLEPSRGQATVDSIQVLILESFPVGVNVVVRGVLPDDCTRIDQAIAQQMDTTFQVIVTTIREPDSAGCTTAEIPFETSVALDVLDLPAGTYTVDVNGVQGSFTLDMDNSPIIEETATPTAEPTATPVEESAEISGTASISGQLWHDLCAGTGQAVEGPVAGCIATSNDTLLANGILDPDEPPIEGAQINLFSAKCVSVTSTDGLTALTDAAGAFTFANLPAGDYCLFLDSADAVNSTILDEGSQSAPSINGIISNSIDITLAPDEARTGIDFAWDYAFLPAPEVDLTTCTKSIEYVEDLNIPDDTLIPPSDTFIKTWRLRNNGTCPWTTEYSLINVGGDPIPTDENLLLPEVVQPGQTADLSITFTAPATPGTYRSNWQIADADGNPFGIDGNLEDAFWVQIRTEDGAPPTVEVDPGSAVISGIVWEDICRLDADGNPGNGCLETAEGSGTFTGDGTRNFGEPGLADVTVVLAEGACPATGNITPSTIIARTVTGSNGRYTFENLDGGIYCSAIDALDPDNVNLLIPGNWTYPARGTGRIGVLLDPAEERLTIDFGWDYQD